MTADYDLKVYVKLSGRVIAVPHHVRKALKLRNGEYMMLGVKEGRIELTPLGTTAFGEVFQ